MVAVPKRLQKNHLSSIGAAPETQQLGVIAPTQF